MKVADCLLVPAQAGIASSLSPGSEFRVRIGARWYDAAYAEDVETGQRFLGVKLNGCDWARVAEDVIVAWALPLAARRDISNAVRAEERAAAKRAGAAALTAIPATLFITRAETEARITAMVMTLKYMGDSEWRFLSAGNRVTWPATVYDAEDIRAQRENHDNRDDALRPPRFKPSPRNLSQLDEAVAWFQKIDPLDIKQRRYLIRAGRLPLSSTQLLVWRMALGASAYALAKYSEDYRGINEDTLKRRHARAIDRLHAVANESYARGAGGLSGAGEPAAGRGARRSG